MSAPTAVTPDTLITAKVTYLGNIRRFKLPLRDLNAATFENKLNELLSIPSGQTVVFERYSDSAASWVKLDATNISVYKQLYRAAKAKLKLRIKAVVVAAPEQLVDTTDTSSIQTTNTLLPSYSSLQVNQAPPAAPPAAAPVAVENIDNAVARAVSSHFASAEFTEKLQETVRVEVEKQTPAPPANNDAPATGTLSVIGDTASSFLKQATGFAIYCNNCNNNIQGAHYHCQQCDAGDFDLCRKCTEKGVHCNDKRHWLVCRELLDGHITWNTEGVYGDRKPVEKKDEKKEEKEAYMRLCNSCGQGVTSGATIKCVDCKEYDLCLDCFRSCEHGHDPRHEFKLDGDDKLSPEETRMLKPGRDEHHNAICDGCDQQVRGVRHKCIDCYDFDYCTECVKTARANHPGHRFLPVYGRRDVSMLADIYNMPTMMHYGVYCDGPRCEQARRGSCIRGVRYKCAICPDTDFCGYCEASPDNKHNVTHPLIKMKTPIRNVLVTTTDNNDMVMGDRVGPLPEKEPVISASQVKTVADVKPTEHPAPAVEVKSEQVKTEEVKTEPVVEEIPPLVPVEQPRRVSPKPAPLRASFISDSVADGTAFPVGKGFTQTWTMENTGETAWPAGITVSFVGGDYMFLKSDYSSLNATVTQEAIPVKGRCAFSVNLTATWPASKHYISYWRLTAPDGSKFGDNIWCSIEVVSEEESITNHPDNYSTASVAGTESIKDHSEPSEMFESVHESMRGSHESEMIFPKLPVESPVHSVESLHTSNQSPKVHEPTPISPVSNRTLTFSDDDLEEVDVGSIGDTESFMTDEEYDVLDASDEESFERVSQ